MNSLLFLIIYILLLTIPGLAFQRLLNLKIKVATSIGFSYSLFLFYFLLCNLFSPSKTVFLYGLIAYLIVSIVYVSYFLTRTRKSLNLNKFYPYFFIVSCSLLYQAYAVTYTEIPSDFYAHLEKYQSATNKILNGDFFSNLSFSDVLRQRAHPHYFLASATLLLSNSSYESVLNILDLVNRTIFLCAVFSFYRFIFKNHNRADNIALIATLFTALHFGINVFAYIRYYSFAPTILAYCLYLTAIIIFINSLKKTLNFTTFFRHILVACLIVTVAMSHLQEALFILIMSLCISTYITFASPFISNIKEQYNRSHATILFCLGIIGFVLIYTYSQQHFSRAPNAHWRLWDFGQGISFIPQLTILNLKFQFIQVITLWGGLTLILAFIFNKHLRSNVFIMAGLISPFITILNPFFVDLFMRHGNSTTLWRLSFLIPIHAVGAYFFLYFTSQLKQQSVARKLIASIVISLLIMLLLPFKNTWHGVHYSRFQTLKRMPQNIDHRSLNDVSNFLQSMPEKHIILTDPMTGYYVSAMSKHHSPRRKFFRSKTFKRFTFTNYENQPLAQYSGKLLIINQRYFPESITGKLSGHWQANQWVYRKYYYTSKLLDHLTNNPDHFQKLWSNNGIQIYKISY